MIRINGAASMLGVSTNTLRGWERRYGFPRPRRSSGGHRHYSLEEIEALRQALAETHNVSSAIALAQRRGSAPSSGPRLADAFAAFDEALADRLLEESLALRSVERTIEEVLLPAVAAHHHPERQSAEFEFAWRHATAWLSAMKRLAPAASRREGVLIFDASTVGDLDTLYAQALEVMLRRAGMRTLLLAPAIDDGRLSRALRALNPDAIVLAGRSIASETIGRIIHAVRSVTPTVHVLDFRTAVPDTGLSTIQRLGGEPTTARDAILELVTGGPAAAADEPLRPPAPTAAGHR
jgi:DNA-binding transcriptional MerR regulator